MKVVCLCSDTWSTLCQPEPNIYYHCVPISTGRQQTWPGYRGCPGIFQHDTCLNDTSREFSQSLVIWNIWILFFFIFQDYYFASNIERKINQRTPNTYDSQRLSSHHGHRENNSDLGIQALPRRYGFSFRDRRRFLWINPISVHLFWTCAKSLKGNALFFFSVLYWISLLGKAPPDITRLSLIDIELLLHEAI